MYFRDFVKRKRFLIIYIVVVLIAAISIYWNYRRDLTEYEVIKESVEEYESMMEDKTTYLRNLEQEEIELEDLLYDRIVEVYKKSDDRVFKYIFEERYPSTKYYKTNRRESFIIIYAMLEICPELKGDEEVSDLVSEITITLDEMENSVYTFNSYLEKYNEFVEELNNSSYVKYWEGTKIKEGLYDYAIIE